LAHELNPLRVAGYLSDLARRTTTPGTPPGHMEMSDEAKLEPTTMRLLEYASGSFRELELDDGSALAPMLEQAEHDGAVTWIDVDGLGRPALMQQVADVVGLSALAVEDIYAGDTRAKLERISGRLFFMLPMVSLRPDGRMEVEALALLRGPTWAMTVQGGPMGDCLEPLRERVRHASGKIRDRDAKYLTYAIIDTIVDHYFPVLEKLGGRVEKLEASILRDPRPDVPVRAHALKYDLNRMRRTLVPLRDTVQALYRETDPEELTAPYLRDTLDHCMQLLELTDTYREVASGLIDLYLSTMSHRMNEVMKVLTVVSSIFIPLTFVVGVYGMNFDPSVSPYNMPELRAPLGYPIVMGSMGVAALALLVWFQRRGWLG
jgi:magnesium transporter